MDWAGEGCFIDPDRGVDWWETEQESLVKHNMQLKLTNPKSQTTLVRQQPINAIVSKSTASDLGASSAATSWKPKLSLDSTIKELMLYEVCVESDCTTNEVIKILTENPSLPGALITTKGEYVGMISRRRFFENLSRPYSLELCATRPVRILYGLAKTEILNLSSDTEIVAAARYCLQRQPELIYEPIVVKDREGIYSLLDVHQLLLAQCQIQDAAAAAVRQAEAKYRNIFENAINGIFQTTPAGRFKSANPALAQILGYKSPAQLINCCNADIAAQLYINQNRRSEFIAAIQEYGTVSAFESQVYHLSGRVIWIRENARAVRDDSGTLLYYEGTVEDITEKKQAEDALREREAQLSKKTTELETTLRDLQQTQAQLIHSEKMSNLGQLVAGVAHEINNPINCVSSNIPYAQQYIKDLLNLLQLYEQQYPEPAEEIKTEKTAIDVEFIIEDLPKILSAMRQGADRIREIACSLRNFSRVDAAQMQPANIHAGIESTLLILHHRFKPKQDFPGIKIIKEYGNLPPVECYAGQLNQVFMNLIGNGIDAIEEVMAFPGNGAPMYSFGNEGNDNESGDYLLPTIRICTEVINDDWVRIRIADSGGGMTEEVQQQLFKAFFTTKPTGKGTGLGLSISHKIVVEKHKGEFKCVSAPGQGSEFIIDIPICQQD